MSIFSSSDVGLQMQFMRNTGWNFSKGKSPAVERTEDRYLCFVTDNSNLDSAKKK